MNLNMPLSIVSLRSVKPWSMQASNLSKGHFNMNKISRFNAAVQGDPVDRPPVTSWVHFQSDHLSAHAVAQLHLRFLEAYDWDLLQVMNECRYPVPAGLGAVSHAEVVRRYLPVSMD